MKYNFYLNGLIKNALQSMALILFMAAILASVGYLIAGLTGVLWALGAGAVFMAFGNRVPPKLALRMYNARRLEVHDSPELHELTAEIARHAGLPRVPDLYYIPSRVMNAFTVGSRDNAAIAFTDGILRNLEWDETAAIIAHEISHVRRNDLWIMGLADTLSRFTGVLSNVGIIMLLFYLPFMMVSGGFVPFPVILILLFAPTLSVLLQLALSRTREFDADLGAVKLTCDPGALARALKRIEEYPVKLGDVLVTPGRKVPAPSMLRTHPHTEKRLEKLAAMAVEGERPSFCAAAERLFPDHYAMVTRKPRWRVSGLWH
ncbi:MAG TPA: peptidase M48 [Spirochaetes bacterium]|nr:peptidase M48 [Spirochaetota bacterium]